MKLSLLLLGFWLCLLPHSQAQTNNEGTDHCNDLLNHDFKTVLYDESQIFTIKDFDYTDVSPVHEKHKLDLYFPPIGQNCPDLPLVVLFHGGAFFDKGEDGKSKFKDAAIYYARRGYLVAVPNYRLNMCTLKSFDCEECDPDQDCFDKGNDCEACDYASEKNGALNIVDRNWYKATQDGLAALHFAHQYYTNYVGVNITKTYVYGHSAGAIVALHMTYADQAGIDNYDINLQSLGLLNSKFHSQITSPVTIDGCVSISGAIVDPLFINNLDQTPVFMVHGECDMTVPYCRSFCQDVDAKNFYGSRFIASRFATLPITSTSYRLYSLTGPDNGHQTSPHVSMINEHALLFFSQIIFGAPLPNLHTAYDTGTLTFGTATPNCN